MIIGNGIDITYLSRIKKTFNKFESKFITKILNIEEIKFLPVEKSKQIVFLAKHWCVKEAVSKAIGCGLLNGSPLHFKDIIVSKNALNKPIIIINNEILNAINKTLCLKVKNESIKLHLSTTNDKDLIVASAILELL